MKVAAVMVIYRGCFHSLEVFSTTGKARKRYEEILEEYDLQDQDEDKTRSIVLEAELIVK